MTKETENVEIYFICDKKTEMDLAESYYDKESNTHHWYFNAYLAYHEWKNEFKGIDGDMTKVLLTVAASKYLIYCIDNKKYETIDELKQIKKDLRKINPKLKKIVKENKVLSNL